MNINKMLLSMALFGALISGINTAQAVYVNSDGLTGEVLLYTQDREAKRN